MIDETAQRIADVLDKVKSIARQWSPDCREPQELWFRGQAKASYSLLPRLFRAENAEFHYDEENLFERFQANGAPYAGDKIKTPWDWYFLAQHHGLPTRLLDWTENLLAAIYFAIAAHCETGDRRAYNAQLQAEPAPPVYDEESPAVWLLDGGSLNDHACDEDDVFAPGGCLTQQYLPPCFEDKSDKCQYPLAILPRYTNNRLLAQQGVFTVHGYDRRPIDVLPVASPASPIRLAKIRLDRANLARLWEELELAGVNRMALFPDLDSVSYCVRWFGQHERTD